MTGGQSDSSIVLGDGRTDHGGKGRTERLNEHSSHALGRTVPNKSVSRTLLELREKGLAAESTCLGPDRAGCDA